MTFRERLFGTLSAAAATVASCMTVKGINNYTELTAEDRVAVDDAFVREQNQRPFVEDLIRASDRFFTANPHAPSAEEIIVDNQQINQQLREMYNNGRIIGGLVGADAAALPDYLPSIMINRSIPLSTSTLIHEMAHHKYGFHNPTYVLDVVNIIRAIAKDSRPALGDAIINQGDIPYFMGMEYFIADLPHMLFETLRTDMSGRFSDAEVTHFYERFSSLPPDEWNRAMTNFVSEMPVFGGMVEEFGVTKSELLTCYKRHPEYQESAREVVEYRYQEWLQEHPHHKPEAKHSLDHTLKNFR